MVHADAQSITDDAVKKAARRMWAAERRVAGRLYDLAAELAKFGVHASVDWGLTAWEPCLHLDTTHGRETVWCRPVAVGVDDGKPIYRCRFCWGDYRGRLDAYSCPAGDVPRAARRLAAYATKT